MAIRRALTMVAVAGTAFVAGRRTGDTASTPYPDGTAPVTEAPARPEVASGSRVIDLEKRTSSVAGTGEQPPGADAESPTEIPAAGWKQILKRAWKEQGEDNVGLLAAGVAFYAFTALFPALIAAVTLYGLVADPQTVQDQIQSLSDRLPPETATLISKQLTEITNSSSSALGIGLVVSVLGALFSASGGVGNLIKAINIAYDEEETRGMVKLRLLALALTIGAVVFILVAVGLIAVVPPLLDHLGLGIVGKVLTAIGTYVALVLFMVVALGILYRYAPDRDAPKFRWVGLGALVATVLWVIGSIGFSLYVSNFGSYGKTYGALAGVVVLLLWLYLTSFIVLLGAEINSESEQQTARDSTEGPEVPMGERQAVKADSVAG